MPYLAQRLHRFAPVISSRELALSTRKNEMLLNFPSGPRTLNGAQLVFLQIMTALQYLRERDLTHGKTTTFVGGLTRKTQG
jgi:hypothetical protein